MKLWQIEYWDGGGKVNPIEKWLNKRTEEQVAAVAREIAMLEESGNELGLPHSGPLGKGLFELRERKFGYRIYYCFQGKRVVILLAAGDKTTQERDIKIARKRLAKGSNV